MMNLLFFVGFFGILGTAGALECDTITMTRCMIQLAVFSVITMVGFMGGTIRE